MVDKMFKKSTSTLVSLLVLTHLLASCSTTPSSQGTATNAAGTTAEGETCAPEIKTIDFGIISTESQDNLKPKWEPFVDAMEAGIGRPVNGFYATDYAGVIEAMGAGKVQMAWYGGKAYISAAERSQAEAFTQTIAADGSDGYYSHLITHKDNPIVSKIDVSKGNGDQYVIENASELTFAFNDPESTSGYLVPSYYVFAKNQINPNEAFKQLTFAGSHEATAQAVANQQVDVATNNNESLSALQKSDAKAFENIQIIWTSPVIPSDPIAYRKDLPDCLKEKIKNFFYTYDDAKVLGDLDWAKFVPADDSKWDTIRELNIGKDILEVQNDKNMSAADKQKKLDELNKQLEALK